MIRTLIVILVLGLTSGCQQSPRKHFYLLSAPDAPMAQQDSTINQVVGLGPIELADYLERSHIVRNREANRLQLAELDHWGEPLDKGIARVLAINLMHKNPQRLVEHFPWRSDAQPRYRLRLTIYDLQAKAGEASMTASWKLMDGTNKTLISQQRFVRSKTCGDSASDIAQTYSDLLVELAGEMDKAIASAETK